MKTLLMNRKSAPASYPLTRKRRTANLSRRSEVERTAVSGMYLQGTRVASIASRNHL